MRDAAKTDAASNRRVTMGDWLVWGQFLNQTLTKIPLESSHKGFLISVMKLVWIGAALENFEINKFH